MDKSGLLEGSIQAVKDVEWEPSWGYERIKSMLEGDQIGASLGKEAGESQFL